MIIPNWQEKQNYIAHQYLKYGDCDILLFITNMYRNNPNFFCWLFDDPTLYGCTEFQLDEKRYEEWNKFYSSFDPYK